MLKIYTIKNKIQHKEILETPWDSYFEDKRITKYFDDTDIKIIKGVEETSLLNNETIYGKFSDMPIGIGCLSEGCKTLLCINHAIKTNTVGQYVFNITSCGGNAIAYLAEKMASDIDVYVYVNHSDFGMSNNVRIQINDGKELNDTLTASNEHIRELRVNGSDISM